MRLSRKTRRERHQNCGLQAVGPGMTKMHFLDGGRVRGNVGATAICGHGDGQWHALRTGLESDE